MNDGRIADLEFAFDDQTAGETRSARIIAVDRRMRAGQYDATFALEHLQALKVRRPGGQAGFLVEALHRGRVGQVVLADDLECVDAIEPAVPGLEDRAHAALAQALQQDVGAQQQVGASTEEDLVDLVRR